MNTKKHKGIWPLPGGTTSYVETLYKILEKISEIKPTFEELLSWFIREYNLTGEATPKSMFHYLMRFGFFYEVNNRMILSRDSEEYIKTKDKTIVYTVLNNSVLGIEDILILLYIHNELSLKKINEWFVKTYDVKWGTTTQVSFRMNWLRSLGYVELRGRSYSLNAEGVNVVQDLDYDDKFYILEKFVDKITDAVIQEPRKDEQVEPVIIDNFSNEVLTAQADTKNPEKYEDLITSLFSQLGFVSKHIGGSGEPDIIVDAQRGFKSYRVIIDCKTGTSPIGEYRIDWLTLNDHKKKYKADYVAVVGPNFAGGRLLQRAIDGDVTLITSEFLLQLLLKHKKMPFSLSDFQLLFGNNGLLGDNELQQMDSIAKDYVRYSTLISTIFSSLIEMTLKEEKLDVSGLRIYLNYTKNVKCTRNEIEKCLTLLESKPISAIKREDNYIIPIVNLETLKNKFISLANFLE